MNDMTKSTSLLLGDLTRPRLKKIIKWLTVTVLGLWVGSAISIYFLLGDWPERGTFGDTFGCINALFSGLAFGGVVLAILLQTKELEYQREELQQTRGELKGQKEQLQAQNETLKIQSFENTFFQMLRLHHEIVNAIDIEEVKKGILHVTKGRDVFVDYYEQLRSQYSKCQPKDEYEKTNTAFVELFAKRQSDIGHYFRNLYNIIKFIDRKGPAEFEDKYVYTNIVRAQLSSHELLLLFYNSLSQFGSEKFKPLIEKYHLLKNMPRGQIIQEEHEGFYDQSAFEKQE